MDDGREAPRCWGLVFGGTPCTLGRFRKVNWEVVAAGVGGEGVLPVKSMGPCWEGSSTTGSILICIIVATCLFEDIEL